MTIRRRIAAVVGAALLGLVAVALPSGARAATGGTGGVVLDAFGGIHPFGGLSVNTAGAPYWPGWQIARAVQVLPGGAGGWTLDGFGAIHSWGAAPAVHGEPDWNGWDIARSFVVLPNHSSGYVLDGFGSIHAFGGAPTAFLSGAPYWPGWDIARGLDLRLSSSGAPIGGEVLDAFGGVHPFGAYQSQGAPPYHAGRALYEQLHSVDGKQYAYSHWGITFGIGPGIAAYWSGLPSWNGWDIERDIQLVGSTNPVWQTEPINPYDWNEFLSATGQPSDIGYRPECGVPYGVRSAASQVLAVSIECQSMTAYSNGIAIFNAYVTTGRPSAPTPRGWFHILYKVSPAWLLLNVTSGPRVEAMYAMGIDNRGDLFHDASWEPAADYGQLSTLYTDHASHGCIHVQRWQLAGLYAWTRDGASVYIN